MSKWNSLYNSKIKKGYKDKSDLVREVVASSDYSAITNKSVAKLIADLQAYAKKTVQENYEIVNVTQQMIDEAEMLIDELSKRTTVSTFNSALMEIFTTIPRRMKKVQDYLANSDKDFAKIVSRERDLLDTLTTQVATQNKKATANNQTILEAFGLKVEEHDDELEAKVKDILAKDYIRTLQPVLTGEMIMKELNLPPGPTVGMIKKQLKEAILNGSVNNTLQELHDYMIAIIKKS
jgi:hypothetical protein